LLKSSGKIFAKIEWKDTSKNPTGFQLFTRVGNPMFASYLGHLPTYLLFL